MSVTSEDCNNRKSRLAVFEQVSSPGKNRGIKRRFLNTARGTSESELAIDDDFEDDNLMIVSKTSRKGIRFVDEPLNLSCLWQDCCFVSTEINVFNEHVIGHNGEEEPDKIEYPCNWDNCKFVAPTADFCKRHLCFHSYHCKLKNIGENIVERGKLPPCNESDYYRVPALIADYQCEWDDCRVLFKTLDDFLLHIKMHVNGNPKICKKGQFVYCGWSGCSSKFVTQYKLTDHVRVHTKEKVVACPTCGNMFATKTKFSDHRKRQMAPELQTYQCSQCSKLFATEPLLRDHIRSHINHYKCTMCDMTCPTPSTLAKHMRFRHIDDRPFKCTTCDHTSVTKMNMDLHMTTHIEEKMMECDECGFSCRAMHTLERHFTKYHGDGNLKNYACHICEDRFARGNLLTKHLMMKHEYNWPSGHSRFRYKEDSEGVFRLQTVRYESLEVTQEMIDKNRNNHDQTNATQTITYNLEKLETTSGKLQHSFVLMVSESGENIVCPTDKNIVITVDDLDEKGRLLKSETVCSKEIVTGTDNGLLGNARFCLD